MKLKYIGRHTAVEVEYPDGGGFEVERDAETPDLDEAFAESLLEQPDNWTVAGDDHDEQEGDAE